MEKTYRATQKFLVSSPRKIRLVADVIRKLSPKDAVIKLDFVQKRSAFDLAKVVKAAMAAAVSQGVSDTDLVFKEIQIGEGPRLKRGIAASRGRWHPIKKRMSHIRVVLTTQVKGKRQKVKEKPVDIVDIKEMKETKPRTVKEKKGGKKE